MHISKAFQAVRHSIIDALEKKHHSPTVAKARASEVEHAIIHLKEKFIPATSETCDVVIWPQMVCRYQADNDGRATPVFGTIKDPLGRTLRLDVVTKEHRTSGELSTKVYLKWVDPTYD